MDTKKKSIVLLISFQFIFRNVLINYSIFNQTSYLPLFLNLHTVLCLLIEFVERYLNDIVVFVRNLVVNYFVMFLLKLLAFTQNPVLSPKNKKTMHFVFTFRVFSDNIRLDCFVLFFSVVNSVNMQNLVTLAAMGANSVSPTGKRE